MKKKRILITVVILFLLVIGSLWGIGNYFVNYAITRAPEGSNRDVVPIYEESGNIQKIISDNKEKEASAIEKWLKLTNKTSVSIQSQDGLKLTANQFSSKSDSHKWVILVHGYNANKENMEGIGVRYWENGFHVLTPDMRAHGESEGEYIGMGWLEKNDLLLWIQWILNLDKDAQIALHGVSMGGAAVMMTTGEDLPKQVKVAIEDCGYTGVWDIFASELKKRFKLPAFPALNAANIAANLRAGYDFKQASAIEQVKKSKIPILFLHGSKDDFVPTDMIYPLYEAATCEKEMLIIENAGHAESKIVDPELYYNTIFHFIEKQIHLD